MSNCQSGPKSSFLSQQLPSLRLPQKRYALLSSYPSLTWSKLLISYLFAVQRQPNFSRSQSIQVPSGRSLVMSDLETVLNIKNFKGTPNTRKPQAPVLARTWKILWEESGWLLRASQLISFARLKWLKKKYMNQIYQIPMQSTFSKEDLRPHLVEKSSSHHSKSPTPRKAHHFRARSLWVFNIYPFCKFLHSSGYPYFLPTFGKGC